MFLIKVYFSEPTLIKMILETNITQNKEQVLLNIVPSYLKGF